MPHYKYRFRDIFDIQKRVIEKTGRPKEEEAIYMRWSIAQDWAREAAKEQVQLIEQMIPEEYQRYFWKRSCCAFHQNTKKT